MGNSQSVPVNVALVGGLLFLLWSLLGCPGTLDTFPVPSLAETNRVLAAKGERVTHEQHAAMGRSEVRAHAARYATSGTCARICRSREREGEVCGAPATSGDCGRHDR